MAEAACPSKQDLYAYFVGEMDEGPARRVTEHVGHCPKCQDVLQTLDDADDTLLEQLRRPGPKDPYQGEPQRKKALARAKQIAAGGKKPKKPAGAAKPKAAKGFDPYYRWLGIPPEEQPPDHYRLLGVKVFEDMRRLYG